jgi:hypothetical protein
MANLNITNIPAPRVAFLDERTGLMSREWYRFFLNLFVLTGSGTNPTTLDDLQIGPPNQPELAELLLQINQNIAPQYEDQSGDFLATLDTAQLMSMMARFENAEAAIQGAYLQPVVQTGTIANYNLDGSPTAGGIAYGTGPALAVSAAGTLGQVLTSAGAGTPTWTTPTTGTVTAVSVVPANGLAGTVATATTTPAITLSTTVTGLLKGNGTAISAATSGTDYAPATSGTSILYGNGAGGFSNVTIGTGVAFSGGTLSATGSGGTVTSVTGTAPVVSSGGTTPAISMAAATASVNGYLTSTDWTTFNNKGSGTVTSVAASVPTFLSVAGSPITTSGTLAITLSGTALPVLNGGTGVTTSTGSGNTVLSASPTFTGTVTAPAVTASSQTLGTTAANPLIFNINSAETARLDANNNFLMGTTGITGGLNGKVINLFGSSTVRNITQTTGQYAVINIGSGGTSASPTTTAFLLTDGTANTAGVGTGTSTPLQFFVNNTEAARFGTDNSFLVGTTTNGGWASSFIAEFRSAGNALSAYSTSSSSGNAFTSRVNNTAINLAQFYYSTSVVGAITTNGTITVYGTTSDYRLKRNVQPMMGGLATVAALKPVTYDWISNGSAGEGFIAHELQAVIPDAVHGEKDALNEDGSINAQGVDFGKIVPHLVAAMQEQQTIIADLTTRLAALESK